MAYYLGVLKLFYFINRKKQLVIMYHNILSDDIFDESLVHLGVSSSETAFRKQLDIILRQFKVTTELGVPNTCILSFDDGYKNNHDVASSMLDKHGVPGLFFIPASFFEGVTLLWIDQLLMWVSYIPLGKYYILGNDFIITDERDSRSLLWEAIYQEILSNYSNLDLLIKELDAAYPFAKNMKVIPKKMMQQRFQALSIDELESMRKKEHVLGCHSFKHDVLSLLDDQQLEEDFLNCKQHEQHYNSSFFSPPFGGEAEVSTNVINKCKQYGYTAVFLASEEGAASHYTIKRRSLNNIDDRYLIHAKLSGFESAFKKMHALLNGLKTINSRRKKRECDGNKAAI